ncbi:hypothetical protein [Streptomyces finlayi]|nr:hypothetical protein [Streptomyces finlayi]
MTTPPPDQDGAPEPQRSPVLENLIWLQRTRADRLAAARRER